MVPTPRKSATSEHVAMCCRLMTSSAGRACHGRWDPRHSRCPRLCCTWVADSQLSAIAVVDDGCSPRAHPLPLATQHPPQHACCRRGSEGARLPPLPPGAAGDLFSSLSLFPVVRPTPPHACPVVLPCPPISPSLPLCHLHSPACGCLMRGGPRQNQPALAPPAAVPRHPSSSPGHRHGAQSAQEVRDAHQEPRGDCYPRAAAAARDRPAFQVAPGGVGRVLVPLRWNRRIGRGGGEGVATSQLR